MNDIKFEFVERIKNEEDIKLPQRSTKNSAGYDFFFNDEEIVIQPHDIYYVKTGIKATFPGNIALLLINRSSNPKNKKLMLANGIGLIDADYYNNNDNEGEIAFAFLNTNASPVILKKGDKLGQGMFVEYFKTIDDHTDGIRDGGFGSTGK